MGKFLPVTGAIVIFTHYQDEYGYLKQLLFELTSPEEPFNGKYYRLHDPITFPENGPIPSATYTHLYIRKPDPYRGHVGDTDFYLKPTSFENEKELVANGKYKNARIYPGDHLNMIELHHPDIDTLGYITKFKLTDKRTWAAQ
jgi:hypothetical protein